MKKMTTIFTIPTRKTMTMRTTILLSMTRKMMKNLTMTCFILLSSSMKSWKMSPPKRTKMMIIPTLFLCTKYWKKTKRRSRRRKKREIMRILFPLFHLWQMLPVRYTRSIKAKAVSGKTRKIRPFILSCQSRKCRTAWDISARF